MAVESRVAAASGSLVPVACAEPREVADALSGCVRGGGRFLHLDIVPPGRLLAVCDTAEGPRAWLGGRAAGPGEDLPRPSSHGAPATLHAESLLAAAGVPWAEPQPEAGVHGRGVFTFPLGPVRGDVAESAAWRLFVMGDEVLGLHLGFGYKRRGAGAAMAAAGAGAGLAVAERVTGTSPVAHGLAYCLAWEAALGIEPTPGAGFWRAVLAEVERLHSHLGDLASLANATGLPVAAAELWILREQVLRSGADLCGHRYLRGALAVGGLGRAVERAAAGRLPGWLQALRRRFDDVISALDASTSFLDRLHGAGRVPAAVVEALRPVGPVGRAAGLPYDVRQERPYGRYRASAPAPAAAVGADAWARYRVRLLEVRASIDWLLSQLSSDAAHAGDPGPAVPATAPRLPSATLFLGRVEAPRGELLYLVGGSAGEGTPWVRLRPASEVNWLVVPHAVAQGNVLQDVPIIDASFSLSVSAVDR